MNYIFKYANTCIKIACACRNNRGHCDYKYNTINCKIEWIQKIKTIHNEIGVQ